jgi:hypothetical protein
MEGRGGSVVIKQPATPTTFNQHAQPTHPAALKAQAWGACNHTLACSCVSNVDLMHPHTCIAPH